ncbi:Plasmodium variant antigen protein Cir/Yir/Bir, putative [Plasmodium chabaudi chabaudi]|uniref:Plasmodium variant antigen protein Cir/Yir/Bir, putative n=1 Tax=Plasmodium chabaudi chabaudi TaxID=31271 RepID=A0A1C6WGN8_PLACU|nr:Plasmodium variant antigen protein Cir/Yir/Bir, putative [Plasmodium chabaudi chabaudi]
MAESSCSIEDVYKEFNNIDSEFGVKMQGESSSEFAEQSIHDYCHYGNSPGKGNCHNDYLKMASSGVIRLLTNLKKCNLEYDKLAEYAILFLSYKLNQKKTDKLTDLNDFYNKYIETNKCYNNNIKVNDLTYKDIINKKINLLNIKEISKFNDPFGILLLLYLVINSKNWNCEQWSQKANEFVKNFETLNKDSNNIKDNPFSQILSTLSDDYNNLKNIYQDKKSCKFQPLPELTSQTSPVDNSGKVSEATPSSSLILNTVIPVLSTFFVISLFLGVAYKYSLFGFGKRSQKRYLRENIKK